MTKMLKPRLLVGIACCGMTASIASAAQGPDAGGLDEIVVTASKTGDISAQSAPFTIQAFGEDEMARGQIQGFNDYSKLVAGLATLNKGPDQTQIIIRGVSTARVSHAEPQNQSTSGLYVDEMPVATNAFNPDLDLFDVNRIEVLKGPQGTLFGAGAMSGAIRIITNEVDLHKVSGAASADGESTYHGGENYAFHALVNAPLIDDVLGIRISAFSDHNGGYVKNLYDGRDNYNTYNTNGGRLKALWKLNDQFDVRASVIYQHLHADGRPQVFSPSDGAAVNAFDHPGEQFTLTNQYQTVKFTPDPFDDEFTLSNLLAEYNFGTLKFVSSSSFINRQFDNLLDDTYRLRLHNQPFTTGPFINNTDLNDFAQEFRLSQNLNNGFTWVTGLYFEHHNVHFEQASIIPGSDAFFDQFGFNSATFGAPPDHEFDGNETDDQSQYAAFGEVTIPVAERWSVILGERVFHYKQDTFIHYDGIDNGEVSIRNASINENGNTPKGELTFKPNEDVTAYLQAAKGFRLGGVTEPVPLGAGIFGTNCSQDLASVGLSSLPSTFQSDHLWSYELGAKTRWLEHTLIVNAALFDIEWSNIQTNVFLPCQSVVVVNAGKARSRGGEVEVSWAPIKSVTLGITGAYTDAFLSQKTLAFTAREGDRVPNVPKVSGTASAEFRQSLQTEGHSVFARTVLSYIGSSYSEFQSLPNAVLVPVNVDVDASVGISINSWDLSLYAKNVTNRFNVTGVDPDRDVPTTYSIAPPRTVGAEVRLKF